MNNKLTIQDLAGMLAVYTGKNKEQLELFIWELIAIISEQIETDRVVQIKGWGTFKIVTVSSRVSVHVNTGERIVIPAHDKVVFIPEKAFREEVNKPFESFKTAELVDGFLPADIEGAKEDRFDEDELDVDDIEEMEEEIALPVKPKSVKPKPADSKSIEKKSVEKKSIVTKTLKFKSVEPKSVDSTLIDSQSVEKTNVAKIRFSVDTKSAGLKPVEVEPIEPELVEKANVTKIRFAADPEPIESNAVEPESATLEEDADSIETVPETSLFSEEEYKRYLRRRKRWRYGYSYWKRKYPNAALLVPFLFLLLIAAGGLYFMNHKNNPWEMDYYYYDIPSTINPDVVRQPEKDNISLPNKKTTSSPSSVKGSDAKPKNPTVSTREQTVAGKTIPPNAKVIAHVSIKKGSRLTEIALEYYGDKIFWVYLYDFNKDKIHNPNDIPIGTIIDVPAPEVYNIDAKDKRSFDRAALRQTEILTKGAK